MQIEQLSNLGMFVSDTQDPAIRVDEARARQLAINRILSTDQRVRLKQIATQLQGPSAILELLISGQLKLTDSQLSAIQGAVMSHLLSQQENSLESVAKATKDPSNKAPNQATSFGPDAMMNAETKQAVMSVILQHLTPEQRQAWIDLIGAQFTRP